MQFVVALGTAAGLIQVLNIAGLEGWFLSHLAADTTEYATGYSASAFRKVRPGMSEQEVTQLLGSPIDAAPLSGNRMTWTYTRSRPKGSYWVRAVVFDNGKVEETVHEFYVDLG